MTTQALSIASKPLVGDAVSLMFLSGLVLLNKILLHDNTFEYRSLDLNAANNILSPEDLAYFLKGGIHKPLSVIKVSNRVKVAQADIVEPLLTLGLKYKDSKFIHPWISHHLNILLNFKDSLFEDFKGSKNALLSTKEAFTFYSNIIRDETIYGGQLSLLSNKVPNLKAVIDLKPQCYSVDKSDGTKIVALDPTLFYQPFFHYSPHMALSVVYEVFRRYYGPFLVSWLPSLDSENNFFVYTEDETGNSEQYDDTVSSVSLYRDIPRLPRTGEASRGTSFNASITDPCLAALRKIHSLYSRKYLTPSKHNNLWDEDNYLRRIAMFEQHDISDPRINGSFWLEIVTGLRRLATVAHNQGSVTRRVTPCTRTFLQYTINTGT